MNKYTIAIGSGSLMLLVVCAFFLPWRFIHWGSIALFPASTITVIGEAKTEQTNEKATFTAGVNVIKDNKDVAITEVNTKIAAVIEAVKTFGITGEDIKTENINIYQQEETYYEAGIQKTRQGQWRVNNSVEVVLREVTKAQALTDILSKAGANSIWGPNFSVENSNEQNQLLFTKAFKDATQKATIMAKSAGKKLGSVVSITEGAQGTAYLSKGEGLGGGGGAMEPGTQTIQKNITVIFELK